MEDTWQWYDLKCDLAEIIIPKLENYKKEYNQKGMSIPTWVLEDRNRSDFTEEELVELNKKWNLELDYMILAFKKVIDPELDDDPEFIQEGLNKFAKYFLDFWD